jgi:RNA polymerase sigma-70 factor (ECF subfamily)
MSTDADSDEALMLRYADGDMAAFQSLYQRHRGGLYRYFLRQSDADTCEELFQDVWARVIQARKRYRPDARFSTWLYTLAHNRLVDHWRQAGRRPQSERDVDASEQADCSGTLQSDPRRLADLRDCIEQLLALVRSLPDIQRQAFLLKHEAGLTLAQISEAMQARTETTKSRLRYAMDRLRAAMPAECLESSDHD